MSENIAVSTEKVRVSAKASPNGQELNAEYQKQAALNFAGALELCDGDEEKALTFFNYAYDMSVRAPIRQKLIQAAEGPEKAITKAAKALVDAGLYETEDEARAAVIAQREAKGL